MRYFWLDEYLLSKRNTVKDLQPDWNWLRYKIGDKMYAAVCLDENGKPYYITLKAEPLEGDFLRQKYKDIIPGYYMDKNNWISVIPDGEVPDEVLKALLDKAYMLVLGGFSKKRQREILGISCCGTECRRCGYYGAMCKGCNESQGKVFHAPEGKACPIYGCSVNRNRFVNCGECGQLPCSVWNAVKDPMLSEQEFENSIMERVRNLKE